MASTACNCKLYISGGRYDSGDRLVLSSIIESDPLTDTSRLLINMTVPREYHSISCIDDDTLIVCGGYDGGYDGYLSSCELCHIRMPICIPTAPMPSSAYHHAAVVTADHLYLIGTDGEYIQPGRYRVIKSTE